MKKIKAIKRILNQRYMLIDALVYTFTAVFCTYAFCNLLPKLLKNESTLFIAIYLFLSIACTLIIGTIINVIIKFLIKDRGVK